MEPARMLFAGVCLLFLSCSVDASIIKEMMIEGSMEDNEQEVPARHEPPASDDDLYQVSDDNEEDNVNYFDADTNAVGHWRRNYMIAFSAYLSRDKHLGKNQHIKFDKVLLNDGNGYEKSTGVFRAPVSGVYSFTFVIGLRHNSQIRVNLNVDGKVVVGAIADGLKPFHDVQGTNTVNVHVCKGKPVWVESYSGGRLEGSNGNYRYTSFSGHLLYARK